MVQSDALVDVADPAARLTGVADFLDRALDTGRRLEQLLEQRLASSPQMRYPLEPLLTGESVRGARLAMPITPREAWGCGVTYQRSAEFRDEDATSTARGIYDYVYRAERPETFYKGNAAHCVGPFEPISIRRDSTFTAPEPELALVIDRHGRLFGFTCADDVSAWDIERENPLYLPQSKIFLGCLAIGPVIVTPDELGTGMDLDLRCRILRHGRPILDGSVNTSRIGRTFDELVEFLTRDNPIGNGTVVCTGTGVIAEPEHALQEGDRVEITISGIGTLVNPVRKLA
ncbi:MAG TPA: fumarylacetoacetate hydrolase family protein [Chloroflexota bacterium]|nr:fumarylacetoacetate hydrolase family protein [Chloroflexota bacterium]